MPFENVNKGDDPALYDHIFAHLTSEDEGDLCPALAHMLLGAGVEKHNGKTPTEGEAYRVFKLGMAAGILPALNEVIRQVPEDEASRLLAEIDGDLF